MLEELFVLRGTPANIRSDNGPEFIATAVQKWLGKIGVTTTLKFVSAQTARATRVSVWLKETLVSALKRDPVAVLNDLEILNVTLKRLCEVAAEAVAVPAP